MKENSVDGVTSISHADAVLLMPWFCTGRLAKEETASFRRHLESCKACQELLEVERKLHMSVVHSTVAIPGRASASFARFAARHLPPGKRKRRLPEILAQLFADMRPRSFFAPRFQLAVLVGALLLAPTIWLMDDLLRPPYQTLSESRSNSSSAAEIHVVFLSPAGPAAIADWLSTYQGRVTSGPSAAGVYSIRLSESADLNDALSALRNLQAVAFAEPAANAVLNPEFKP